MMNFLNFLMEIVIAVFIWVVLYFPVCLILERICNRKVKNAESIHEK